MVSQSVANTLIGWYSSKKQVRPKTHRWLHHCHKIVGTAIYRNGLLDCSLCESHSKITNGTATYICQCTSKYPQLSCTNFAFLDLYRAVDQASARAYHYTRPWWRRNVGFSLPQRPFTSFLFDIGFSLGGREAAMALNLLAISVKLGLSDDSDAQHRSIKDFHSGSHVSGTGGRSVLLTIPPANRKVTQLWNIKQVICFRKNQANYFID